MKIEDEFTDLPVSRQRKYQLRHPAKDKEIKGRYMRTDKAKAKARVRQARYVERLKAVDKRIDN